MSKRKSNGEPGTFLIVSESIAKYVKLENADVYAFRGASIGEITYQLSKNKGSIYGERPSYTQLFHQTFKERYPEFDKMARKRNREAIWQSFFNPWNIPGIHDDKYLNADHVILDISKVIKINSGSDIQASGSGLSQKKNCSDYSNPYSEFIKYMENCESAFMDDETTVSRTLRSVNKDVLQGGKSEKPVEKPENSGKMKKMKKVKKVKKVRKTKKTLKNIQATEMNDWDSIVSIEDLKNANVRAVTSKLHSVKSNRGDIKLIHVVTGREVIARIQGPEKMSLTQLGHYLCLGNSTKINQNRQKLRKLMDLVPKSKTTIPAVTSGWSLLTEGDVEYQIQSMMQLTEFLVDKVKIKDEVLESLAGTPAQKAGHIEKTKEIIGQLIKSMNRTELNNAMHGKVFEAFGTILETMLPGE